MEKYDLFRDIAERTGGDIYLGVVGPMRTGKSTFIKRFMDLLILPNIEDINVRERTRDELPQSGAGRAIMTTEPKFVPDDAVQITLQNNLFFSVRLVDCVGYTVPGAKGYEEEGYPRMVRTPWHAEEIPFQQAAEFGTRKVIQEHSTIGVVVTTDGTIVDIPRDNYARAEERVINELKELGKPFIVILNSRTPFAEQTQALAHALSERHNVKVIPLDCLQMSQAELFDVLHETLYEFPVREIHVNLSRWVDSLEEGNWLREKAYKSIYDIIEKIDRVRDIDEAVGCIAAQDFVEVATVEGTDLGSGIVRIDVPVRRELFYQVIGEMTGISIGGDHNLVEVLQQMAAIKKRHDKFAPALTAVEQTGYGIAMPTIEDIEFAEPELYRQGSRFGVRLKAKAPSVHMIRTEITAEVTPFVGTEKQGEEMMRYLTDEFENNPERIWNSDFLGKPLHELIEESLRAKLYYMPENAQVKLQETLTKIVNEGSGGLICIIL